MTSRLIGTSALILASMPASGLACAVCMDNEAGNRVAYIAMTFLLTLLPFALVGGVGFYIWRKSRETEPSVG